MFAAAELDDHVTPPWHPEHRAPARRRARRGRRGRARRGRPQWRVPEPASTDDLALVHDPVYVAAVEAFCEAGGGQLDPDTSVTPGSWATARRSAGAVLQAIDGPARRRRATSPSPPAGRPAITPCAIGRWGSACSTTPRSAPPSWPPTASVWRSSTGTCTTATAPRTCSTTTRACSTCRPTSRRCTPAPGGCRETGAGDGAGAHAQPAVPGRHRRRHVSEPRSTRSIVPVDRALRARLADHLGRLRRPSQRPARRARAHQRRLRRPGDAAQALVPDRRVLVVLEGGYDLEALTYGVGATLSALSASRTGRSRRRPARSGCPRSPPRDSSGSCERATVRVTASCAAPTGTCGGACTAPPASCSSCGSRTGRG